MTAAAEPARPSAEPLPLAADPIRVASVVAGPPLAAAALAWLVGGSRWLDLAILVFGLAVAVVLTLRTVADPLGRSLGRTRDAATQLELELLAVRAEQDFRDRLDRALKSAEAEPATLRTGLRAVAELVPDAEVSLLLNVPDEPRIGWDVKLADGSLEPARALPDTPTCSALTSESTTSTSTSTSLDACAHLHDPLLDVAATCVPLRLDDRVLGSVCVTTAPGEVLDAEVVDRIEWTVDRTGVRVAEQRRAHGPALRGRTDPLTGLPGETALRHHLRDLVRSLSPFCVAVVEIDHYGEIDTDGDADEAIRNVADALCTTLRPDDMICRLDGARFAAVLQQCSAEQASSALERARESLVLLLAAEGGQHVTCSTGIVESHKATSLDEIVSLATQACEAANDAGGNRVAISPGVTTTG